MNMAQDINPLQVTHSNAMSLSDLPPGFRFHPTDEELVNYYLRRRIENKKVKGNFIPELDLYKCEPWDVSESSCLSDNEWYFFSPRDRKYPNGGRTNRATNKGYWKATGKDRMVYQANSSTLSGMKKTLVFYLGRAPRGTRTDWIMHEYRLDGAKETLPPGHDLYVLCRIFNKKGDAKDKSPAAGAGALMSPQDESEKSRTKPSDLSFRDGRQLIPLPPVTKHEISPEGSLFATSEATMGSDIRSPDPREINSILVDPGTQDVDELFLGEGVDSLLQHPTPLGLYSSPESEFEIPEFNFVHEIPTDFLSILESNHGDECTDTPSQQETMHYGLNSPYPQSVPDNADAMEYNQILNYISSQDIDDNLDEGLLKDMDDWLTSDLLDDAGFGFDPNTQTAGQIDRNAEDSKNEFNTSSPSDESSMQGSGIGVEVSKDSDSAKNNNSGVGIKIRPRSYSTLQTCGLDHRMKMAVKLRPDAASGVQSTSRMGAGQEKEFSSPSESVSWARSKTREIVTERASSCIVSTAEVDVKSLLKKNEGSASMLNFFDRATGTKSKVQWKISEWGMQAIRALLSLWQIKMGSSTSELRQSNIENRDQRSDVTTEVQRVTEKVEKSNVGYFAWFGKKTVDSYLDDKLSSISSLFAAAFRYAFGVYK